MAVIVFREADRELFNGLEIDFYFAGKFNKPGLLKGSAAQGLRG